MHTAAVTMVPSLLLTVSLLHSAHSAVPSWGACPQLRGISSFDVGSYTGTWYEYSNVFEVFQVGGRCVRATYTAGDSGDTVGVFNEQISSLTGEYGSINGTARLVDPALAEFVVNFDKVPFTSTAPNYRVLDTDYTGYSIVYNCHTLLGLFKTESLWFLTRQQLPDQQLVDAGYQRMAALGLPVARLRPTQQTDCGGLQQLASTSVTI